MFYCDPCARRRKWPSTLFKSSGTCEICEKHTTCNELASKYLPDPVQR